MTCFWSYPSCEASCDSLSEVSHTVIDVFATSWARRNLKYSMPCARNDLSRIDVLLISCVPLNTIRIPVINTSNAPPEIQICIDLFLSCQSSFHSITMIEMIRIYDCQSLFHDANLHSIAVIEIIRICAFVWTSSRLKDIVLLLHMEEAHALTS